MFRIIDDDKIQQNKFVYDELNDVIYREDLWNVDNIINSVNFIDSDKDNTKIAVFMKLLKSYIEKYVYSGEMSKERFSDIICVISNEKMALTPWNIETINMRINNGEFEQYLKEIREQKYRNIKKEDMDWWFDDE